jgi:hypothetical protein
MPITHQRAAQDTAFDHCLNSNWLAARGVETPPPEVMIVQIEVA